jgi:hypothetical protein
VHERRSDIAKQAWQPDRHAKLLRSSGERKRPHSIRYEVREAGRGGDDDVGALHEAGKLSQEVEDVRLVSRALPAEDVRVDDDEPHEHALA